MINGIINIKKEKGFTSHDVVAKLRGILKQKKIGHTGTLDPDATGVLPVCLGNATKLCDLLTDKSKEYTAVFRLGITTDTQDISGTVLTEHEVHVTKEELEQVVLSFLGDSLQIPPMYSALKVNGQKLYDLARQGKEVERKPRPISISKLEINWIDFPNVSITVGCSKGTYIRTLCYDIGEKLGCGATMTELVRTKVGEFLLNDAHTLSEVEEFVRQDTVETYIKKVEEFFAYCPLITPQTSFERMLLNGNRLYGNQIQESRTPYESEKVRVYTVDGTFYAIYEWNEGKNCYMPFQMFQNGEHLCK